MSYLMFLINKHGWMDGWMDLSVRLSVTRVSCECIYEFHVGYMSRPRLPRADLVW